MAHWALVVAAERFATERLFANETVDLPAPGPGPAPGSGDAVLLIAGGDEPVLFGLGRVPGSHGSPGAPGAVVAYTHRIMDPPIALGGSVLSGLPLGEPGVHPLDPQTYAAVAGEVGPDLRVDWSTSDWLVSVVLPIEATGAAEAARAFWSYVSELGPRELPVFVTPAGDELAMQVFVRGAETTLDPDEDAPARRRPD